MHTPVLITESIDFLSCRPGGFYVDCTLGMGGHAERILEVSAPDGRLLALDRDEEAVRFTENRLISYENRLTVVHEDYRMLRGILDRTQSPEPNGILVDLGPSMLQFTSAERGFSFQKEGPLDMRMDRRQTLTAEWILNHFSGEQLLKLIREYGEEPSARAITTRILEERKKSPIQTTAQLTAIIESVKKRRPGDKIHPATKTFQALRIAVNGELEGLDKFVFDAFDSLAPAGRMVAIGFHSLEDRIIKHSFQFLSAACRCPKRILQCICGGKPLSKLLTKKPVTASAKEVEANPASRSAKLRAIEKIAGTAPRDLWPEWLQEK
ncbi:16S rRNA (cytosine(1402)-N(4))-methyltransferase RsmH [bacterium]|nr:16S rRNA (cytosine(1402)-N(4))-methyltransferase RsmH [bacterium]